jgi:transcriptional regulator with XRE-family HTH domain
MTVDVLATYREEGDVVVTRRCESEDTAVAQGRKRELTPGKSPAHFFGAELRRAREATGISMAEFCVKVPCAESTLSRVEGGILSPDRRLANVCDEVFPQYDGWFTRFYLESREWVKVYPPSFRPFTQIEREAVALYFFEHSLVPGMLQADDYARAILSSHPNTSADQVEGRVKARLARQAVLTGDSPPLAWFVLDEASLHRQLGSPAVMRAQVARIADMAKRANITIQILTATAHVGLQGALSIAETDDTTVASLEDLADGRLIEVPRRSGCLRIGSATCRPKR